MSAQNPNMLNCVAHGGGAEREGSLQTAGLQLDNAQLEAFLHTKGIPQGIIKYFDALPSKIDTPIRSILDCGGGNGQYLDMLLDRFPEATGTLVDSAQFMLDQNKPHPRKQLLLENLENMTSLIDSEQKFDLICFSDVLHHCIVSTYKGTRELQTTILNTAANLLAPNGSIVVSERIFDSWITDEFSTKLIYTLTRSKILAGVTRFFGANTAGVGVCFLSKRQLLDMADLCGLHLVDFDVMEHCKAFTIKSLSRKLLLGINSNSSVMFRFSHGVLSNNKNYYNINQ